jgi:hypothetical protein
MMVMVRLLAFSGRVAVPVSVVHSGIVGAATVLESVVSAGVPHHVATDLSVADVEHISLRGIST